MKIFVTGIGTGVGKTVVSAILCEALKADYWKPVQSGSMEDSDTMTVQRLISNPKSVFHAEACRLKLAASPHAAAAAENRKVKLKEMKVPHTSSHLIIEGAGGLLVPLNDKEMIIDLIQRLKTPVVLVSQHYLGSINHTLLSVEALKARGIKILGIIFNGNEEKSTEQVILRMSGLNMLGRVGKEKSISKALVRAYAGKFRKALKSIIK